MSCAVFVFYNKRRWTNHVRLWFCLLNFCSGFCCLTSSSQTENVNTEKQISESFVVGSADLFKMFNNLQRISLTCCKFKATKGQPSLLGCHNPFPGARIRKKDREQSMNGKILMFFLSLSLRQKLLAVLKHLLIFEIFLTATKTGEKFDINFSPRPIERKWKYIANFLWRPKRFRLSE